MPTPFIKVSNELSVQDGLLLREEKLVIPLSLQHGVIQTLAKDT